MGKTTQRRLRQFFKFSSLCLCVSVAFFVAAVPAAQSPYYPPPGKWERRTPEQVGMDAAKLTAAIEFAKTRENNMPRDFSMQEKIFGTLLGPIPKERAATNGVVIRRGYVVAEFGETNSVD